MGKAKTGRVWAEGRVEGFGRICDCKKIERVLLGENSGEDT
jgi:hypothetical protein